MISWAHAPMPPQTGSLATVVGWWLAHVGTRHVRAHAEADDEDGDESGWAGRFGALVTGTYAQLQIKAAEKCGVAPGEAWRTALEAAAMAGARQVGNWCLPMQRLRSMPRARLPGVLLRMLLLGINAAESQDHHLH